MYEISSQENYLLVNIQNNFDSQQAISAIKELFSRDDYSDRNDIWNIGAKIVNLSFQELEVIAKTISYIYPSNATRSKTAFVVTSLFPTAMASEFIKFAKTLPYELRIFDNLEEAEQWLLPPVP